jgi:thymidylate kinase
MRRAARLSSSDRISSVRSQDRCMLPIASTLLEQLNGRGIAYCHWKSNWMLEDTLAGETDFDLLVHRQDASSFRTVLQQLGFRGAIEVGTTPFPSVEHHLALDEASSALVHVHAYYRVITGGSLAKNYRLPLEEMLLGNVRRAGAATVPSKGAELVVFVLRMYLKHTTLAELVLVARYWGNVRREVAWLATDEARAEAEALLPVWLPGFDPTLFGAALDALRTPAPLWRRIVLGRRVRTQLRPYARRGRFSAWLAGERRFVDQAMYRLRGSRKGLTPGGGGAVIAFVGSEATGKSTMLEEMERWLGVRYTVQCVHAGKPPSTPLTVLPNLLLPALRFLLPEQRSTRVSARRAPGGESGRKSKPFPLLFGIRSVLLAHDRRALLTRAFASSANGTIVLSDRYPSVERGAVDGAQLSHSDAPPSGGRVRRWLADLEARLYRDIPPPDLVIHLTAPVEITLERNRTRTKSEPEDYVLLRLARSSNPQFARVNVQRVDTSQPLEESMRKIKRIIWEAL